MNVLSGFAVSQPHAAFSAFSKGFKSKFTYFFRTIPEIAGMLEPIECVLENKLITALFGSESPLENKKRQIIGLPVSKGGLGFGALKEEARFQNENSKIFSKAIIDQLSDTTLEYSGGRKQIATRKREREKELEEAVSQSFTTEEKRKWKQNTDKGASTWLTALPLKSQGMNLSKTEFGDSLR